MWAFSASTLTSSTYMRPLMKIVGVPLSPLFMPSSRSACTRLAMAGEAMSALKRSTLRPSSVANSTNFSAESFAWFWKIY